MSDEPYKPFSRRQTEASGQVKDKLVYNDVPLAFRHQVIHTITEALEKEPRRARAYEIIEKGFSEVAGLPCLGNTADSEVNIKIYIQICDFNSLLDIIDFIFNTFWDVFERYPESYSYKNAINRLNYWLAYHSIGYRFNAGKLVRIDSELLYREAIKPAFGLISDKRFEGASDEFQKAFDFRRKGDNKQAIIEAGKSFESTMKVICDIRNYPYDPAKDTAHKLIATLQREGFFPAAISSFIPSVLETGLPVIRNKIAAHGQGATIILIPDDLADYALHLAASNIVFLVSILNN